MSTVVTRFPPSPTGHFHIGSARTALFNFLFTKHHDGVMYLRFEDTDKERSKKEYEDDIIEGLRWLSISYTPAQPLRQSERLPAYRTYLHTLIEKGAAYEAEESEGGRRAVRFKNPNSSITFSDAVRGEITFDTSDLKDFVIARNTDDPLYHMAVVADDHDMGVTNVIRGEDHISNTPRQILILEALGFERPQYAHIPLILAADRSKLSKRHGAISVNEYRTLGYLPEALVNYLSLLGWNPGDDREIYSLDELVEKFSLEQIQKGGAIFNLEKLYWFNSCYLKKMPAEDFNREAQTRLREALESHSILWDERIAHNLLPLIRERTGVWSEIREMVDHGDLDYFFSKPAPEPSKIPGKGSDIATAARHLAQLRKLLETLPSSEDIEPMQIKKVVWDYAEREGRGAVLWPLRYALTGKERSPDPFLVGAIIGREGALERIDAALTILRDV